MPKKTTTSKFSTWKPRHKDLAGQLDLNGSFSKEPDVANEIVAKPLDVPTRNGKPIKAVRMVVRGNPGQYISYWIDSDGNVVSENNRHPYTGKKS